MKKIANVPREGNDRPTTPVTIRKITFARTEPAAQIGPGPDPYR